MHQRSYHLRFLSPAFLGNAEQVGQWRTPPIKALLRQFWRVAYAADRGFNVSVDSMRRDEATLFGSADRDHTTRSLVRIRLSNWDLGKLHSWDGLEAPPITHPEVERSRFRVGPQAYLGYGPLDGRGGTKFSDKVKAAIHADEQTTLDLAYPDRGDLTRYLEEALALIDRFGAVGGRSRNAWGSVALTPRAGTGDLRITRLPVRDWKDALQLDWPHALGRDKQGVLAWHTRPFDSWRDALTELARIKIAVRTAQRFKFAQSAPSGQPEARHWLAYPVTNHKVRDWDRKGLRLPNTLRFKLQPAGVGKTGKPLLRALIFHMPCRPTDDFRPGTALLHDLWQHVHTLLDATERQLKRLTPETV